MHKTLVIIGTRTCMHPSVVTVHTQQVCSGSRGVGRIPLFCEVRLYCIKNMNRIEEKRIYFYIHLQIQQYAIKRRYCISDDSQL